MNSSRPYIIRAIYEWIVDNGCTPHLLVGGVATDIVVPIGAILGIYARENGQGMVFDSAEEPDGPPEPPVGRGRPSLKVVK